MKTNRRSSSFTNFLERMSLNGPRLGDTVGLEGRNFRLNTDFANCSCAFGFLFMVVLDAFSLNFHNGYNLLC